LFEENHIQFYKEGIFLTSNWYFIFYWAIFGILFLFSIFEFIKEKKDAWFYFLLTLVGIVSLGVMMLTPTWGERVSALFILIIIITTTKMISCMNLHYEKISYFIRVILIGVLFYTLSCTCMNKLYDIHRQEEIYLAIENKKTSIRIQANLLHTLWNYDPWDKYHLRDFKKYHKISEETSVTLKVPTLKEWLNYLIYGKKEV